MPFTITGPGAYRTRNGRRVTVHEVNTNQPFTFPVKGSVWKLFRGKYRPRGLCIWRTDGRADVMHETPLDIVGPWIGPDPFFDDGHMSEADDQTWGRL